MLKKSGNRLIRTLGIQPLQQPDQDPDTSFQRLESLTIFHEINTGISIRLS